MSRSLSLLTALCLTGCAHPGTRYLVELDVYVTDEAHLCKQAWDLALADHGPAIAELLVMTGGQCEASKALATVVQKGRIAGAESRGIYVRRPL